MDFPKRNIRSDFRKQDQSFTVSMKIIAGLLCLVYFLLPGKKPEAAEVGPIKGLVQRLDLRKNKWEKVRRGDSILKGDRIRTGRNSRVELVFKNKIYLRASANSEIDVRSLLVNTKEQDLDVNLTRGTLWTSVLRKLTKKSRVKIRTPVAVMAVKGTQFNTVFQPANEQLEIIVVKGRVEVLPPFQIEGPEKIQGPKEILGPREITREEWMAQVSSGEILILNRRDEKPIIGMAGPDQLENDWILFNRERDRILINR